jgi:hypothetical protein
MPTRASIRALSKVALAALVVASAPADAWADPAPGAEAVARAREHFRRGVQLYGEDDFRAALIEFSRAYQLAPNPAVLYNVGQSYYQLRDYAGALSTLEKYLRDGGEQIAEDRRTQVQSELRELRGRVAHVAVRSNVAGAELAIDDVQVDRTQPRDALLVGAGRHKLSASKRGYATTSRVVDIAGGDDIEVRLDLAKDARDSAPRSEAPNYTASVVAATVAGAGVVVGVVFGLQAVGNKSSLAGECNAARVCPSSARSDVDAFSRNTTISTIGFSAGAAAMVAAGYFFFHARASEAPVQAGGRLMPWVGAGSAGVAGTF